MFFWLNTASKTFTTKLDRYEETKEKTGSAEEAKLELLADESGVDLKKVPEEEKRSLLSFFSRSKFGQFFRKRK